jgi:hypothetical protein
MQFASKARTMVCVGGLIAAGAVVLSAPALADAPSGPGVPAAPIAQVSAHRDSLDQRSVLITIPYSASSAGAMTFTVTSNPPVPRAPPMLPNPEPGTGAVPSAGDCWASQNGLPGGGLFGNVGECMVDGLLPDVAYTFTATASDNQGNTSAPSAESNSVTLASTTPLLSPPGIVQLDHAVVAVVSPPVSPRSAFDASNNLLLNSYTVTATPVPGDSATATVQTCTVYGPAGPCLITGLQDTYYSFTTTAHWTSGVDEVSAVSQWQSPQLPPDPYLPTAGGCGGLGCGG